MVDTMPIDDFINLIHHDDFDSLYDVFEVHIHDHDHDDNTAPPSDVKDEPVDILIPSLQAPIARILQDYPHVLTDQLHDFDTLLRHRPKDSWHKIVYNPSLAPRSSPAPHHLAPDKAAALQAHVRYLLDKGLIQPCHNVSLCCPAFVVRKKTDSSDPLKAFRFVADFRAANKAIMPAQHVLPTLEDLKHRLSQSSVFGRFDMSSAFFQQVLHPDSRQYTCFRARCLESPYSFKVSPQGLADSSAALHTLMQRVLRGIVSVFCHADDVLLFANSHDEFLATLREVMERFSSWYIVLDRRKALLGCSSIEYLGFVFSNNTIALPPSRCRAITGLPQPHDRTTLRRHLAFLSYFRSHIPNFAVIAKPLSTLTSESVPF
jgi:hypothetical protein